MIRPGGASVLPALLWIALCAPAHGDYVFVPEGTVTDPETGLMWMRCSLGQIWIGRACDGYDRDWDHHVRLVRGGGNSPD